MSLKSTFRGTVFFVVAICALVFTGVLTANAQNECNSTGAPIVTTGDISLADTVQPSRLFRDGRGGTCQFLRPVTSSAVSVNSDAHTFTNTTGGPICVYVDLDATGCGVATNQISVAAYLTSYTPATPLLNVIGDPGLSTGQNFATSMNFSVPTGATYIIVVHTINNATTCPVYSFKRYITNNCRSAGFDAANDGKADLALFRGVGPVGTWYTLPIGGSPTVTQLGSTGDSVVPGDYTGDETTDTAVFRPGNGTWYLNTNAATNYGARQWGASSDIPVQGDYDRDGITDLAVFRPTDNNWYILRSDGNVFSQVFWGATGDKPVPADYDGDGKMDPAVFRPSNGLWTCASSAGNNFSNAIQLLFGQNGDVPVPADYDGDGKADLAVFRPTDGSWYIFRTSLTANQTQIIPFGTTGDIPQPADYDGDRKADPAVFRPSTGVWWLNRSTDGITGLQWGQNGDIPASSATKIP